jgi:type I pantothenate kinase
MIPPASLPSGNRTPANSTPENPASESISPYRIFTRADWAALRAHTPLTLSDAELERLRGVGDPVSLDEVRDVYLPLTRLLNLQVAAHRQLQTLRDAFLGRPSQRAPYLVAIAGSVAVGKSTFARVLAALLARWPDHPRVALVATDGFLLPNRELEARSLMHRKGFPESYDQKTMLRFLARAKAGDATLSVPVYSHVDYDIVPDKVDTIERPDMLLFEGLNVLQTAPGVSIMASDFFDFSIYVDADEASIEDWFLERFLLLQRTAFQNPDAYFHRFADMDRDKSITFARDVWRDINLPNLRDNIAPTRDRADLIVRKKADHSISEIRLRGAI